MRSNFQNYLFQAIALLVLLTSCTKESDKITGHYSHGLFIVNEGPFTDGTGTITYFNHENDSVEQDIFDAVNNRPLGNIVQSISFYNGKAYIIVNNAAKTEVVDAESFKSEATITGMTLPRYFCSVSETKAYISDWAGVVNIVDLSTNTVAGTIPAGTGPERMLKSGKYVFVLNAGGFTLDSTITILDHSTDRVVKTMKVFDRPTGIVEDASGKIWVMCSGKGFTGWPAADDTKGHLISIDPTNLSIEADYEFQDSSKHPEKLVIKGSTLYFLYDNGIFRFSTLLGGAAPVKVASHSNLYNLAYDYDKDYLLASDPVDFMNNGWVVRFRADNGEVVDSIPTGIIPGDMVIK
jgi:hypothetical protein